MSGDADKARLILGENIKNTGDNIYSSLALLDLYDGDCESALKNINIAYPDDSPMDGDLMLLKAKINMLCGKKNIAFKYYQEAIEYCSIEIRNNPEDYSLLSKLGIAHACTGNKSMVIKNGTGAVEIAASENDAMIEPERIFDLARIYCMVGENEQCIQLIEKLTAIGSPFSIHIVFLDPDFKDIRNDERIVELREEI